MIERLSLLKTGFLFVFTGLTCASGAQVYQVGQDHSASPNAPTNASRNRPAEAQSQSQSQSLGWGSNIQNARLARAAQLAIQQGHKAQAVDYAQRAAESAPNDPQLWFLLGFAARIDSRFQLSLDAYNKGLKLAPGSLDGQSGVAQVYNLMGRTRDAENLLKKIIAADPRRRNDALLLGEIYMRTKDYNDALDWLSKAERMQPDARSELLMALSYQQLKQMDQASQYLEMARRRAPNNPDVQRSLAGYYREEGKYPDAIAALKSIRNPSPDVVAELAYTYELDGKPEDSARLYAQAADSAPADLGLQLAAAQAAVDAGRIDDAQPFLKRAQGINADAYRLHAIRGQIAQIGNHYNESVKEYQTAIAHLPPDPAEGPLYGIQLHMDLVTLDRALGSDDAAQRELAIAQNQIKAVDGSGPNRPQYLRLRALIELAADDPERALADVKEALAANPDDRNNLQLNGDVLMKLNKPDDAIAVYKRILKQDANNRFALTSIGYAERAAGRNQEAEKYFKLLAQADPGLYVPHLALGDLYTALKEYSKAQVEYNKALTLAPDNGLIVAGGINAAVESHDMKTGAAWMARITDAMNREPQLLREKERYLSFKGDYAQSAAVGEQAIKVLPRDRDVVVYLGYDLLYLQKYGDLLRLSTSYMDVLPGEPDIPLLAGYVYKHNGDKEKAEEAFSEAIRRDPGHVETAYVNRGYMLNDLHEPESAAADFETALKMQPGDGEAHLGLAYSDLDLQKYSAALRQSSLAEKSMGDVRDVHVIRATAYASQALLARAVPEYRAALRFTPNDGPLHMGLGNALLGLRRYHDALAELQLAVKYEPGDPNPYALLARCYAELDDRQHTVQYAELAEKHALSSPGPEQSEILVSAGEALLDLGDESAAMERFSRALSVKGSDRVGVRLAIAGLMAHQDRAEDAERQIGLAVMEAEAGETAPPTATQYIAAADVFRSLHDYELSQNYLQRAKTAGAPDAQVRIGLANNYLALGETEKAAAELAAVKANADTTPTYQFLLAQANVYQQEHQGAQALTSFAQATSAAGDDQSAQQSLLAAGADEGMRVNPMFSVLSDYSTEPIFEDTTVYVLDSKLDASQPIPPTDTAFLPPPRSSIQNQQTAAFHLHLPFVPTPAGFFQVRNARGDISAPSSFCGAGSAPTTICTVIVDRDTTDYNMNFSLNPVWRTGRNLVAFSGGIQETIRRDSLQPVTMNQNLFRLFLYGSTSSFFNAVSASGFIIRETGPFTLSNLSSTGLTGAIDFRIGSPWGRTALITGWGASNTFFTPRSYQAYFTSSYIGFERRFAERVNVKALVEDVRAWRIQNANSAIAQNLRPAAVVDIVPAKNWQLEVNSSYSSERGFPVYDAMQNGFSISYALPVHRRFMDQSGPVTLAYPIRFSAGMQQEKFFNFAGGQQQYRPYVEISIF